MLQAKQVYKKYGTVEVLRGVDFTVNKGEIVSLVGASGAGKSTLLHIMGTLDDADKGEVWMEGQKLTGMKSNQLAHFRNKHIGFIFQFHHLLPEFTAFENICVPAWIGKYKKAETEKRANELLSLLGIAHRKDNKPSQLSGGEQQRVAVARALINQPDIILADEPSGNLDSTNARELHKLFFTLRDELGQTFLIVTHNDELAAQCDRKVQMKDGLIMHQTEI